MKLKFAPLSVNHCWQGRRFKTEAYKAYEKQVFYSLPPLKIPEGKLKVYYEFGLSCKMSDIDNPIKPLQDILQKKYKFNDRSIYEIKVNKVDVPKGEEYIIVEIEPLPEDLKKSRKKSCN